MKLSLLSIFLVLVFCASAQSENLDTLMNEGAVLCDQGQIAEGMKLLAIAKDGFKKQEDWHKFAEAGISYWFAYYQMSGDADTALEAFGWMQAKVKTNLPDSINMLANLHLYKGILYYYNTDIEESMTESEKALELFELDRERNLEGIGSIYNNLGVLFSNQGNDKKAEIYFLKSLGLKIDFERQGLPYSEMTTIYNYLNLANLYYFRGDFDNFLKYQKTLTEALVTIEQHHEVKHRVAKNYAKYYLRENQDLGKAKGYLDKLKNIESNVDLNFYNILGTKQLEAEYYLEIGDTLQAENIHLDKVASAEQYLKSSKLGLIEFYTTTSEFYAQVKDYKKGMVWTQKSLDLIRYLDNKPLGSLENGELDYLAIVYGSKTAIHYLDRKDELTGRLTTMEKYGDLYMNVLREFAVRVDEIESNHTFVDFNVVLAALMEVKTLKNEAYDAMELIELKQAIPLLKSRKDIATVQRYNVNPTLVKALKATSIELNVLRKSYNSTDNRTSNDSIAELIFRRSQTRDSINNEIKKEVKSKGGQVLGALDTEISPDLVNEQMGDNECILHVFHYYEDLYLVLKTQETVNAYVIDSVFNLEEDIAALRNTLTDPNLWNKDTFNHYSESLYTKIITPIADQIRGKSLAIIPTGVFNYLPFEVLVDPSTKKYLLESHAVRYMYSLKDALLDSDKRTETKRVAFAPNFGNEANKAYAVRSGFDALAGAEKETSMLADRFSFDLFTGNNATKKIFLKTIENAKFIHLASHAQMDENYPMQSYIVFDNADTLSEEEQRLYAYELYNMSLNADLAVLSACNTGMGKQKKFNGVISLARAFQFAGVKSTIMSLWPAQDESTAEIMELFYNHLSEGKSKSEALREAKLDYLKTADNIHAQPFYWAPFILQGNNDPVPMKTTKWFYILLGALAVGALIVYIFRKKSSASAA